ncbi:hypothetical protein GH714_033641 [Hevea brasiliensis]|uniref:Uncharacterized protein n=1 Tax=Hevea brasiliensis TaxID=3981 RepID=A0A6A6LVP6_HEVBR|nr:hypothetical protein GH714_033641 [Hevea brasiliensis]
MESEASIAVTKTNRSNKDPAWKYVHLKCLTYVPEELQEYMQQKASAKNLDKLPDYEDVETLRDGEDEDDVGVILGGSKGSSKV